MAYMASDRTAAASRGRVLFDNLSLSDGIFYGVASDKTAAASRGRVLFDNLSLSDGIF